MFERQHLLSCYFLTAKKKLSYLPLWFKFDYFASELFLYCWNHFSNQKTLGVYVRIYFKNVLCKTTCFEANAIKRKKTFEANFKFGLLRNQLLRAYSFTLFWTGLHRFLEYTIHLAEPAWLRDSYFY